MIGPFTQFKALFEGFEAVEHLNIDAAEASRRAMFLPPQGARAVVWWEEFRRHGLDRQPLELVGEYLILPSRDTTRRSLHRTMLYSLATPSEALVAMRAHIDHIGRNHGAGRVWFLGEPVHTLLDDGRVRCAGIGDEVYVVLRTMYGHESQAVHVLPTGVYPSGETAYSLADRLDHEIDGIRLRELVARDELQRRERSGAKFTPAQRAAVSAHLSSELRKRVEASDREAKRRDRMQVVVDLDDD